MTQLDNPRAPEFARAAALTDRLERAASGLYQVEGERLVRQALAAGRLTAAFLIGDQPTLAGELAPSGIELYQLPSKLLPKLIGTGYRTSLSVVGLARREILCASPSGGLLLAADTVQDPRNVGVLVRCAEAAGTAALLLADDSADPFSRAAVRSSTGSILRQPLQLAADLLADLAALQNGGFRVIATSARAPITAWEVDLTGDVVILLGNETTGLGPALLAQADAVVGLPMHGDASSLNVTVAAGILLYEAQRQRRR